MSFLFKKRWSLPKVRTMSKLMVVGCLLLTATLVSWVLASGPALYTQAAPALPTAATAGTWTATGSLHNARDLHTATLLSNGRVLLTGGLNGNRLATAELYDPAIGSGSATGSLNQARFDHTATLLSNGQVLVAGGIVLLLPPSSLSSDLARGHQRQQGRCL